MIAHALYTEKNKGWYIAITRKSPQRYVFYTAFKDLFKTLKREISRCQEDIVAEKMNITDSEFEILTGHDVRGTNVGVDHLSYLVQALNCNDEFIDPQYTLERLCLFAKAKKT